MVHLFPSNLGFNAYIPVQGITVIEKIKNARRNFYFWITGGRPFYLMYTQFKSLHFKNIIEFLVLIDCSR